MTGTTQDQVAVITGRHPASVKQPPAPSPPAATVPRYSLAASTASPRSLRSSVTAPSRASAVDHPMIQSTASLSTT
jgi:hypothetical protein